MALSNNYNFNRILHLTGCGRDVGLSIDIFKLGGMDVSASQIKTWRTVSGSRSVPMSDELYKCFFDGLFEYRDQQGKQGNDLFYTSLS